MAYPAQIAAALVFAHGLSILVKLSPAHELLDVLNLNVVRANGLDIAEEVLRECPAVRVTGLATFCPAEIGTLQRSPQHHVSVGVLLLHPLQVANKPGQLQRSDVLGKVKGVGVVGLMGCYGVGVMVYAGHDLRTLRAVQLGILHAR